MAYTHHVAFHVLQVSIRQQLRKLLTKLSKKLINANLAMKCLQAVPTAILKSVTNAVKIGFYTRDNALILALTIQRSTITRIMSA